MHSSKMLTVRCSGCLGRGGISRGGAVLRSGCLPWVRVSARGVFAQGRQTPPPPVDRILDTRLWKHYLPQLLLRTVKILKDISMSWYYSVRITTRIPNTKYFAFVECLLEFLLIEFCGICGILFLVIFIFKINKKEYPANSIDSVEFRKKSIVFLYFWALVQLGSTLSLCITNSISTKDEPILTSKPPTDTMVTGLLALVSKRSSLTSYRVLFL